MRHRRPLALEIHLFLLLAMVQSQTLGWFGQCPKSNFGVGWSAWKEPITLLSASWDFTYKLFLMVRRRLVECGVRRARFLQSSIPSTAFLGITLDLVPALWQLIGNPSIKYGLSPWCANWTDAGCCVLPRTIVCICVSRFLRLSTIC